MVYARDIYSEDQMASRAKLIEHGLPSASDLACHVQKLFNLLIVLHYLRGKILEQNLLCIVLYQLYLSLIPRQKINNILIVYLNNWDWELIGTCACSLSNDLKELLKCPSRDASISLCPFHCVSLATSCLAICNYTHIVPIKNRCNKARDFLVHITLRGFLWEDTVELKLILSHIGVIVDSNHHVFKAAHWRVSQVING